MNKKTKRIIFFTMIVIVLLLSLCSTIIEITHDCDGADCHVCAMIGSVHNIINQLGITSSIFLAAVIYLIFLCIPADKLFTLSTPVLLKTRLDC